MMRNDYRRALILLRSGKAGYSGHVRLERRTLMGSMYFLIQAPPDCESLRAALVGRGKDSYYACALGDLRRDSRGQAVLGYSFDPRNVCGRELEKYQLIALTCAGDGDCHVVLYGNVAGHADLNWERVRTALCGLYADKVARAGEAVGGLPEAEDAPAAEAEILSEEAPAEAENAPDAEEETQEEIIEETWEDKPAKAAGALLNIDLSIPWPEAAEGLRSLFQTLPPMENPPDGEHVYIAAPMPAGSGYPHCAVGLRAEGGEIVSLRYALPAPWSEEAPAGMENHFWLGDQNAGWWAADVAL